MKSIISKINDWATENPGKAGIAACILTGGINLPVGLGTWLYFDYKKNQTKEKDK